MSVKTNELQVVAQRSPAARSASATLRDASVDLVMMATTVVMTARVMVTVEADAADANENVPAVVIDEIHLCNLTSVMTDERHLIAQRSPAVIGVSATPKNANVDLVVMTTTVVMTAPVMVTVEDDAADANLEMVENTAITQHTRTVLHQKCGMHFPFNHLAG